MHNSKVIVYVYRSKLYVDCFSQYLFHCILEKFKDIKQVQKEKEKEAEENEAGMLSYYKIYLTSKVCVAMVEDKGSDVEYTKGDEDKNLGEYLWWCIERCWCSGHFSKTQ